MLCHLPKTGKALNGPQFPGVGVGSLIGQLREVQTGSRTIFKEMQKHDWAFAAICLAASIFFGIYSVKLAIDYRTQNDAPRLNQRPT